MELRRNPIPKNIFTPLQGTTTRMASYHLIFFNETESYQIVHESNVRRIDTEGSATLMIRNKSIKCKVILSGTFLSLILIFYWLFLGSLGDCESELQRQTRLSQQENSKNAILSTFSCINHFIL